MNGAIGRVQEKEEEEEPEETSGPKPILPYTSMFVFRSEDQIRVACHYIGIVVIPKSSFCSGQFCCNYGFITVFAIVIGMHRFATKLKLI